jgi:hypothetical protein
MELLRKAADSPRLEQPRREVVQTPEAVAAKRRLHELGWGTRMMTAADPIRSRRESERLPESGPLRLHWRQSPAPYTVRKLGALQQVPINVVARPTSLDEVAVYKMREPSRSGQIT